MSQVGNSAVITSKLKDQVGAPMVIPDGAVLEYISDKQEVGSIDSSGAVKYLSEGSVDFQAQLTLADGSIIMSNIVTVKVAALTQVPTTLEITLTDQDAAAAFQGQARQVSSLAKP